MKFFYSFRLDTTNHCLWREDERVSIPPKAFDVLRYLVEHPGRLVTQDEILEGVWPETFVNPEVIKKYILGIRKVLGDNYEKPVFIETLPRRGYQFVAPVVDEGSAASDHTAESTMKMVGRETALAELTQHLKSALRGQRQLIFVTGEAGIGKTTLVDVFHQQVARQPNVRIARGQCVEGFGGKEAYYPMLEALGQFIRDAANGPVAQMLTKRAPTWVIQLPSLIKPEQRQELQKEVVGATRDRMVRELCEALEGITSESPLVLILEDVHWVDPSTLDLLSALARRREAAKLVVICTYRPVDVVLSKSPLRDLKRDLQVHGLCSELVLERLEKSDIALYLDTEFADNKLPGGLASLIYRHSGGNALFMVTIVQDLVKKGLIGSDEGVWHLSTNLEEIDPGVPETLQQMLEAQFDQLSEQEQRVLKSGSVAGERFSLWAIGTTLDIQPDQIEEICDRIAERQQFIKSAGIEELPDGSVSANYEFRHSLYRQAIYRRLSEGTRLRLHRSLGERLKALCTPSKKELAAELAAHFEAGREYEQAVRYLILAAENAAGRFAYRDSIELLQHALDLIANLPAGLGPELEMQVLEFIGDAHYALGTNGTLCRSLRSGGIESSSDRPQSSPSERLDLSHATIWLD
jgi:predicted ATPase